MTTSVKEIEILIDIQTTLRELAVIEREFAALSIKRAELMEVAAVDIVDKDTDVLDAHIKAVAPIKEARLILGVKSNEVSMRLKRLALEYFFATEPVKEEASVNA